MDKIRRMITRQASEVVSYACHARKKLKPQSISGCAWSHILAILKLMEAFIVENSKSTLANNLYRSRRRNPLILHTHIQHLREILTFISAQSAYTAQSQTLSDEKQNTRKDRNELRLGTQCERQGAVEGQ